MKIKKQRRLMKEKVDQFLSLAFHEAGHAVCCEHYGLKWWSHINPHAKPLENGGRLFHATPKRLYHVSVIAMAGVAGEYVARLCGWLPKRQCKRSTKPLPGIQEIVSSLSLGDQQRSLYANQNRALIAALLIIFRHRDRLSDITEQLLRNLWAGDSTFAADYIAKYPNHSNRLIRAHVADGVAITHRRG